LRSSAGGGGGARNVGSNSARAEGVVRIGVGVIVIAPAVWSEHGTGGVNRRQGSPVLRNGLKSLQRSVRRCCRSKSVRGDSSSDCCRP
jgi:hypothetical protein